MSRKRREKSTSVCMKLKLLLNERMNKFKYLLLHINLGTQFRAYLSF